MGSPVLGRVNRPEGALGAGARVSDAETQLSGGLPLDIFDSALVGIAATSGPDHRLRYTNRACQEIIGERTIGLPAREAFGDLDQLGYVSRLDQVLETGHAITLPELPFEYRSDDRAGQARYVSTTMSKISLTSG